jgi:hypothetical protein
MKDSIYTPSVCPKIGAHRVRLGVFDVGVAKNLSLRCGCENSILKTPTKVT